MSDLLHRLANHHGLTRSYADPLERGPDRPVPDATLLLMLRALGVDTEAEPHGDSVQQHMRVPQDGRCWLPPSLKAAKSWGVFCQLYELRSERNWGIGDFEDLAQLATTCGKAGADFLGVNPVHALFLSDPDRRSPFFPSNRRFLNPLYIAPDRVEGVVEPPETAALRKQDFLHYPAIAGSKIGALRTAFDAGISTHALDDFVATEGEAVRLHALYEAISGHMVFEGHGAGWHDWPAALQDPAGAGVAELALQLEPDIRFHLWLQMIARQQLHEAATAAHRSGMRIGLYLDMAVGEAPDGSATWSQAAVTLPGLSVGAPPDMFAAEGQNWGLAAPSPLALRDADYAPFRDVIWAQIRDCGALRIDHAMALWQMFLIPDGASPAAGTHLRFPFSDLIHRLSALSRDHQTVVIGEDLGFVPEGFREAMAEANVLSYRILVFEQDEHGFKDLASYPEMALACLSTHDLPVFSAWWRGEDIVHRSVHGLINNDQSLAERAHREKERTDLIRLFHEAGVLGHQTDPGAAEMPEGTLDAAHRFLAHSPSLLAGVRLADLVGPEIATNIPGTTDEYPNWRPRCPIDLAEVATHPAFVATAALMREVRPRPTGHPE